MSSSCLPAKRPESAAKRTIVVFGAMGSQGSSVVAALKSRGRFRIRAATRNPDSESAKALAESGVDVIKASFGDVASLDSALTGAYGAFFITSFWDCGGTVTAEVALGRQVALAAKKAGVKHLVFSGLESPAAMLGQHFPTFDSKAGIEQEILYAGVPFTFLSVAWYFNNLENNHKNMHSGFYGWPKTDAGEWLIELPIGPNGLHGIHNGDVGEAVATILDQPDVYLHRKVALSGELLTGDDIAKAFQAVFPEQKFKFVQQDVATLNDGSPMGQALFNMYSFYIARNPAGGDLELTRQLNPNTHTLQKYLEAYKTRYKFE